MITFYSKFKKLIFEWYVIFMCMKGEIFSAMLFIFNLFHSCIHIEIHILEISLNHTIIYLEHVCHHTVMNVIMDVDFFRSQYFFSVPINIWLI